MTEYIRAPFNFVPVSSKVFFPGWADQVSQDVPFSDALSVADALYTSAQLDDESELVLSLYFLGDICRDTDRGEDKYLSYREEAIRVMEEMKACGTLEDEELLSDLHGEVARIYMGRGDMATAEKHLLKQVSYNLNGSTEYMRDNGIDH